MEKRRYYHLGGALEVSTEPALVLGPINTATPCTPIPPSPPARPRPYIPGQRIAIDQYRPNPLPRPLNSNVTYWTWIGTFPTSLLPQKNKSTSWILIGIFPTPSHPHTPRSQEPKPAKPLSQLPHQTEPYQNVDLHPPLIPIPKARVLGHKVCKSTFADWEEGGVASPHLSG